MYCSPKRAYGHVGSWREVTLRDESLFFKSINPQVGVFPPDPEVFPYVSYPIVFLWSFLSFKEQSICFQVTLALRVLAASAHGRLPDTAFFSVTQLPPPSLPISFSSDFAPAGPQFSFARPSCFVSFRLRRIAFSFI